MILRAQRGDMSAFEDLVYTYDKQVMSVAMKLTRNPDEAKDIYQEVFLRVYGALKGFKFESRFSTWLYRITTNVCLTHLSRDRTAHHVSIDGGPFPNTRGS